MDQHHHKTPGFWSLLDPNEVWHSQQQPELLACGFPWPWGYPKMMVYNGKSHLNRWFGGTSISGNHHIFKEKKHHGSKQTIWPLIKTLGLWWTSNRRQMMHDMHGHSFKKHFSERGPHSVKLVVSWNGATPSHHLFKWDFPWKKTSQRTWGTPMASWKPTVLKFSASAVTSPRHVDLWDPLGMVHKSTFYSLRVHILRALGLPQECWGQTKTQTSSLAISWGHIITFTRKMS